MNQGILSWRAFILYGALLFGFGVFGPDYFVLWGALFNLWMLLAGIVLFVAGFAMAFVLVVTGRMTDNRRTSRSTARSANQKHLNSYATGAGMAAGGLLLHDGGGPVGPTVNVDGTPMLNDSVDVAGKAYGDSGDSFNHGSGSDLPDGGFSSGIETHHTGSTTW